jgi:hypothetical protein
MEIDESHAAELKNCFDNEHGHKGIVDYLEPQLDDLVLSMPKKHENQKIRQDDD